jgi:hypothetical protein
VSSIDIVTAASDPAFYSRVSYHALKVAQMVSSEEEEHPNHANRVSYANRVFQGADNAVLLAQHVATNPAIASALEEGPEVPTDGDIEFTLTSIWDARANAFASPATGVMAAPGA